MDVTNQNRWNKIWAVATATCFLSSVPARQDRRVSEQWHVLFEQNAGLVDEFASVRPQILLEVPWNPVLPRRRCLNLRQRCQGVHFSRPRRPNGPGYFSSTGEGGSSEKKIVRGPCQTRDNNSDGAPSTETRQFCTVEVHTRRPPLPRKDARDGTNEATVRRQEHLGALRQTVTTTRVSWLQFVFHRLRQTRRRAAQGSWV